MVGTPKATYNSDQFMGKIDYNLNPNNQMFVQGNWLNSPVINPGLFPGQGISYPLDTELVNVGWNSTIGSNKVNVLRIGGIRDSVYSQGVEVNGIQNQLNITGTADVNGVPSINFTNGYTNFGTSTGLIGNIDNNYQIQDSFNWLLGKHQIGFGIDIAYTAYYPVKRQCECARHLQLQWQLHSAVCAGRFQAGSGHRQLLRRLSTRSDQHRPVHRHATHSPSLTYDAAVCAGHLEDFPKNPDRERRRWPGTAPTSA